MKTVTNISVAVLGLALVGCSGGGGGGAAAVSAAPSIVAPACPLPASSSDLFTSNTVGDLQVFGDSLASGYSSCDSSESDLVTKGYAGRLATYLGMTLDNRAEASSTITGQLARVQALGTRQTQIKLLMAGYNDALAGTPINTFKANLTSAIQIMAANSYYTAIATPPYSYSGTGDRTNAEIDAYITAIEEVVLALNLPNVAIVDTNALVAHSTSNFADDQVNLNKAGSQAIAQALYNVLRHQR